MGAAVKVTWEPAQMGLLSTEIETDGVTPEVTETLVVAAALVQLFIVTVTEYVPDIAVVALAMVGFWEAEVNELGPAQL